MNKDTLAANSKQPFDEVYKQYYSKILYYYSSRVSSKADAEDLTSAVFEYCYLNYDKYDPEKASVSTWIFLVASSRWKNYCRDHRPMADLDELEEFLTTEEDDLQEAVELESDMDLLKEALLKLTEQQRMIVIQKYFYEKSAQEIGDRLGMTANNVRVVLSRTLKILQKYMTADENGKKDNIIRLGR